MISSLSNCNELRIDGDLRREAPESVRETLAIPDGEVRLRCGSQVVERVKHAEARLRHQRSAVVAHAADRFGDPGRIAGEELVVFGRPQEPDDAQLDDEIVDDFLGAFLGDDAGSEVALEIDVEKRRGTAKRHRGAVLLFYAREVAEVQPLHRFLRGRSRTRDVEAVAFGHLAQLFQRADLLGQLLAIANDVVG